MFVPFQYDQAFDPHRLQNWEVPKQFRPVSVKTRANKSMAVITLISSFLLLQILLQTLNTKQDNCKNLYQVELFITLSCLLYLNLMARFFTSINW